MALHRKNITTLLYLLVLALLVYLYWNRLLESVVRIRHFNFVDTIQLLLCIMISQYFAGLILKLLSSIYSVQLYWREWMALVYMRALGNYLPMSAGLLASGAYLKKFKSLNLLEFGSITICSFLLSIVAGMLMVLFVMGAAGFQFRILLLVALLLLTIALALLWLPFEKLLNLDDRWTAKLRSLHVGWGQFLRQPAVLSKVAGCYVIMFLLFGWQFYLTLQVLWSESVLYWQALVMAIFSNVIRFFSIVPGNIGLRESVAGLVGGAVGVPFEICFIAGLITRAVNMLWIFLFGSFASYYLISSTRSDIK